MGATAAKAIHYGPDKEVGKMMHSVSFCTEEFVWGWTCLLLITPFGVPHIFFFHQCLRNKGVGEVRCS